MIGSFEEAIHLLGMIPEDLLAPSWNISLDDMIDNPKYIVYQRAIWLKSQFKKGRHPLHRHLMARIIIQWSPHLVCCTLEQSVQALLIPDAIMQFENDSQTVLLEADTGKETKKQWNEKLLSYRNLSPDPSLVLIVVADGKSLRLKRMAQWTLEASLPIPWAILSSHHLDTVPPIPQLVAPRTAPLAPAPAPVPYCRSTQYRLWPSQEPIATNTALSALDRGLYVTWSRQRFENVDVIYLQEKTLSKNFPAKWQEFRRRIAKFTPIDKTWRK